MQNIYSKISNEVSKNKDFLKKIEYLRLCSYNVAYKLITDIEELFKYSHILVLQEVNTIHINHYGNLCSKYGMLYKTSYNGTRDNSMLLMVCYKPSYVKNSDIVDVKYNDVANRSAIFIDTVSPNGKHHKICCTHLSQIRKAFNDRQKQLLGEQKRLNEIQLYSKYNPDLIIGDLNFSVRFNNKSKCHELLNSLKYGHTTSYDNKKDTTSHKGIRVDHAFYKHGKFTDILKSVVLDTFTQSDHRPIIQLLE